MKTNMKGFTLVEIMIVVAIIGLLIAIALPNFLEARKKAQTRSCVANMRNVDGAIQQGMIEDSTMASAWSSSSLISQNYLKISTTVKCPVLGSVYSPLYPMATGAQVCVECPGVATTTDHHL